MNVFLPQTLGCGLSILAPLEAHWNLDPIWVPVLKGCLVPTYRGKAAFLRKWLFLIEKSVIALVKKGFFPAPKHMPYAINYIFPITVADKCPRVFRDFLKIDIVYEFCSLIKNSKGTFFFNSSPSWE